MRLIGQALIAVVFVGFLVSPSTGSAQITTPVGTSQITYSKDDVRRMLLDAGASTTAVLDSYPSDYEFTEDEVRELLKSIPQEELLQEYRRRQAAPEKVEPTGPPIGPMRRTPYPYAQPRAGVGEEEQLPRHFGYDVFAYSPLEYTPAEDISVGPDYVLGPGDELQITLWGAVEKYYKPMVNREGNIVLPELGVVQASGSTLASFEKKLKQRFSGVYSGFSMDVSLSKLRTIQVFVVGDVTRPGAYTISSVSTVFNALYYAGGPTRRGSLRRVLVYRSGKLVCEVDLYQYLLKGDSSRDITLKSGDTVFVTTIGATATVKGAVKRPAIYELLGGESARDVVELAGGFTAEAFPERIEIARITPDSGQVSLTLNCSAAEGDTLDCLESATIADGDEMTVYSVWHVFPKQHVSIQGMVQFPGDYPLYPGMTVSDLVFRAGGLLEQAYLMLAEISRIEENPEASGLVSDLMFIDLGEVVRSPHSDSDVVLNKSDKVFVRKIPGWRPQHLVKITGEVRFPGTYTLKRKEERLSYLIERAGGLTPEAFPSAGSVYRGDEGRLIVNLAKALEKPGDRDDITLVDGDSVHIPVYLNTIKVEGAVGRPGAIVFRPGKSAEYYIDRTGGFLDSANKGSVRIVRLDGSTDKARKRFWFDPEVEPGNKIVVGLKDPNAGIDWTATIKDATTILASMATTIYIITRIDK